MAGSRATLSIHPGTRQNEHGSSFGGLNGKYIAQVEQALLNVTLSTLEALAKGLECTESALLAGRPRK